MRFKPETENTVWRLTFGLTTHNPVYTCTAVIYFIGIFLVINFDSIFHSLGFNLQISSKLVHFDICYFFRPTFRILNHLPEAVFCLEYNNFIICQNVIRFYGTCHFRNFCVLFNRKQLNMKWFTEMIHSSQSYLDHGHPSFPPLFLTGHQTHFFSCPYPD